MELAAAFAAADPSLTSGETRTPPKVDFKWYVAPVYRPRVKPEVWREQGLKQLTVLYRSTLWKRGSNPNEPDLSAIRTAVSRAKANSLICFDIEHWPLDAENREETLRKLIQVVRTARQKRPDCKFGFYGILPKRDYWTVVRSNQSNLRKWRSRNNSMRVLADEVDALFPSLYTFYPDKEGWAQYAEGNLAEARRLAGSKPVYPFLWDIYHPSGPRSLQPIEDLFLTRQIQVCRQHADGLVWWTGKVRDGYATFTPDASWLRATRLSRTTILHETTGK